MEGNQINLRVAKIVTSLKTPDRFLSVKIHKPAEEVEKEYGSLYFLIEILSPWFPSTEIGQKIIDQIIKEYYGAKAYESTSERFEEALKKANVSLAEIAQKGETDWMGNLNALVAAVKDKTIYLASTGKIEAYLFRDKAASRITEEEQKEEEAAKTPIRTFISITSGDLEEGDKIFLANSEISNWLSSNQINQIATNFDPITSIHEIAKILRRERVTNINCLLIEIIPKEKEAFAPPTDLPDTIYLDQREEGWLERTVKKAQPKLTQAAAQTAEKAKTLEKKTLPILRRIVIFIGRVVLALGRFLKNRIIRPRKSRREIVKEQLKEKTKFREWEDFIEKPPKVSLIKKIGQIIWKIVNLIFRQIFLLFTPGRRKLLYGILIIIFIALMIWGIKGLREQRKEKIVKDAQQILTEAKEKENQAKSALALNKQSEAKELLLASLELLNKIKDDPKTGQEAEKIIAQIQPMIDEIDRISRVTPELIFDFNSISGKLEISEFFLISKDFYATSSNNKIYKISLADRKGEEVASISQSAGQPVAGTIFSESLIWYTENKNVYQYDPKENKLVKAEPDSGSWAKAIKLASFVDNLYFLDLGSNQIIKYTKSPAGWSKGKEALDGKVDISKSVSFAIDGYIYVLSADGSCYKFLKGKLISEFGLRNIPTPQTKIEKPVKIFTNTTINSLFIADAAINRIIEFDKDGSYIRQFVLSSQIEPKDIIVNQKTKKIYILGLNKIYQIAI